MTVHDQLRYGPLAGVVSLRQDIADRADRAYRNARRIRAVIVVAAAAISLGQLACRFNWLSAPGWVNEDTYGISLAAIATTLLASALVWTCRERMEVSRTRLASYLSRLPVQCMD